MVLEQSLVNYSSLLIFKINFAKSFFDFFFFFLAAGIGCGAGILISNITLRAINKRRSKALFYACATGVVLGAIPIAIALFFLGNWFAALALVLYAAIVTPTVYTRISGIQL